MDNFTITWNNRELADTSGIVTEVFLRDNHIELTVGVIFKEYTDAAFQPQIQEIPFKRLIIPWNEVSYLSTS
ncbi:hypothetical protein [Ruegeria sp. HKCCA5426]|uniref:hypothetical protein n=1 Tax=Ruegeria sp. HKCCA5426 TaxID=2682985 RepID=UPI001488576E|nr:hypothetical protein [Ruegeria sp. HKCCA5426]